MIDRASQELAELVLEGGGEPSEMHSMFGKVLAITTNPNTATVQPDSVSTGQVGPLLVVCGKAVVNDRVLCLFLPDNNVWVVIAH